MKTFQVAVIGAGHLGRIHSRLAREIDNVELFAIADPSWEAGKQIAQEYQVSYFADYRELINDIDAAIVATPTRTHFEITKTLLDAGIHVLVEKPMTDSSADAQELVEIAEARGLVLQVGHVERFNPVFDQIRTKIKDPKYIQSSRTSTYTFRSTDVGVVHDLMIHDVDLILSMNRSEVVDIRAIGFAVFGGHEDMAQARIEFANGCVANIEASRASHIARREMQIFSEQGWYGLDFATATLSKIEPSQEVRSGTHGFASMNLEQQAEARDAMFTKYLQLTESGVEKQNAILEEQLDFVNSIRTSGTPRVTAADGCEAVTICDQILSQIAAHNWTPEKNSTPAILPTFQPQPLPIRKAA